MCDRTGVILDSRIPDPVVSSSKSGTAFFFFVNFDFRFRLSSRPRSEQPDSRTRLALLPGVSMCMKQFCKTVIGVRARGPRMSLLVVRPQDCDGDCEMWSLQVGDDGVQGVSGRKLTWCERIRQQRRKEGR